MRAETNTRTNVSARTKRTVGNPLFEALEERQLFAWGSIPVMIGQDLAASTYSSYNGSGTTIVALDTGTNVNHPALAGRIWTNPFESANGRDDDGDGLVDNVNGWNFVGNNSNIADDQGHGTMVAGILLANRFTNTGNSRGYSGDGREYAGPANGAKLITLKVADASGGVTIGNVEAALRWVVNNRARFNIAAVNVSLGLPSYAASAIEDEMAGLAAGGVFVGAAAGNGYNTNDIYSYPGSSQYATSVGAATINDGVASITSRGRSLDMLAPGDQVPYLSMGSDYYVGAAATSYATPFATAAAAILKQVNPSITPAQIQQVFKDSGKSVYDPSTGFTFKRLNIKSAIDLTLSRFGGTSAPTTTPAPAPTWSTPFTGTPIAVPGLIEAENFDNGGEGLAYHDANASNSGGRYRSTGVDIESCAEGGHDVGWTTPGEWYQYTISLGATGTYDLSARVAAVGAGGTFHIEIDGVNVSGTMTVPDTGAWHRYATITRTNVQLSAGRHVMRVVMDKAGPSGDVGNLNWFKISPAGAAAPAPTPLPVPPPITIQAENATSLSGINRGSTNLSWVDQGDSAEFRNVDFGSGYSTFSIRLALANEFAGRTVQVRLGSPTGQIIGSLTTRGTGGWGSYATQATTLTKVSGVQNVYLTFANGYGVANIDSISFS